MLSKIAVLIGVVSFALLMCATTTAANKVVSQSNNEVTHDELTDLVSSAMDMEDAQSFETDINQSADELDVDVDEADEETD